MSKIEGKGLWLYCPAVSRFIKTFLIILLHNSNILHIFIIILSWFMEIDSIVSIVAKNLISVNYEGNLFTHELEKLLINWTEVDFLTDFFTEHLNDLQTGVYSKKRIYSIDEAIEKTIDDAEALGTRLKDLAEADEMGNNLQILFKPLSNSVHTLKEGQKSKGYEQRSWLRVYAIRFAPNIYVISGGAIKLTETKNDRPHLLLELDKLEATKRYLTNQDLIGADDFEYLELE